MKFEVLKYKDSKVNKNTFYLEYDAWDDFGYTITYNAFYMNDDGELLEIGSVKIASNNCEDKHNKRLEIGSFEKLPDEFFSLGYSEEYYIKIKELGQELREKILTELNDIAYDSEIFDNVKKLHVTNHAVLRALNANTVSIQYRRIARGGAKQTAYNFHYISNTNESLDESQINVDFQVKPESNPPTNIHVIIGRNGVGKTRLMKNILGSIVTGEDKYGIFKISDEYSSGLLSSSNSKENRLTNVIYVAFSAFDNTSSEEYNIKEDMTPLIRVGLPQKSDKSNENIFESIVKDFKESLNNCLNMNKYKLWKDTIENLYTDPIFKDVLMAEVIEDSNKINIKTIENTYKKLSSGHKIILLTLTKIIEHIEEKSLIILDEPENHLHPPLLSSFMRSLSQLVIFKNAVAIIATHSPVILQEVPKKCVKKLRRNGKIVKVDELERETFGENIGVLTREVFGYEAKNAGFHKLLVDAAKAKRDYDGVIKMFNEELGTEARVALQFILLELEEEQKNEDNL